jgi:hypothetical protein
LSFAATNIAFPGRVFQGNRESTDICALGVFGTRTCEKMFPLWELAASPGKCRKGREAELAPDGLTELPENGVSPAPYPRRTGHGDKGTSGRPYLHCKIWCRALGGMETASRDGPCRSLSRHGQRAIRVERIVPRNGGFSTSIGIGMGKRDSGATLERLASGMQPNQRCPQQGGNECDDVFHTVTG